MPQLEAHPPSMGAHRQDPTLNHNLLNNIYLEKELYRWLKKNSILLSYRTYRVLIPKHYTKIFSYVCANIIFSYILISLCIQKLLNL